MRWEHRNRRFADLSGGDLQVLFAHGGDDVVGHEPARLHLFGVEPDAHGVVARAEGLHFADARDACNFILYAQGHEVGEVDVVVLSFVAVEADVEVGVGRFFLRLDAEPLHFLR